MKSAPDRGSTSSTSAWRPRSAARACNRRYWIERKPKQSCPACGGELIETEERRRAIKGGFATQKECQSALNKVLTAVDARSYVPPTRITVKAFLRDEWLPAIKGTLRPTTYASYTMLAKEHVIPRLGSLQLQKLTPASINALYAHLGEHGRVHGGGPLSASSVRRVHAVLHRACHDAVRWGRLTVNPVDAADPPKQSSSTPSARCGTPSSWPAFLPTLPTIASTPSGACWP